MPPNLEALLKEALPPVEPPSPEALLDQLQERLTGWHGAAQEELDAWELSAMRDPRNWARPALAAGVTVTAGAALVVLRVQHGHDDRVSGSDSLGEFVEKTLQDVVEETKRVIPDGHKRPPAGD
ncbi:MAG: hypothetical protein J2O48_04020 [Solirubrobacterales bacterium]|nr:hypothetical protein [Solirubrobacterales bacterium]